VGDAEKNGDGQLQKRLTLKQLPPDERPRERLLAKGPGVLTDAELLAIIIRDGTRRESALDLARRLILSAGSLRTLSETPVRDLCKISGIGPARAAQIKAALALAGRLDGAQLRKGESFTGSSAVYEHFHPRLRYEKQECFLAVLMDTKNRVQREVEVSKGGLSAAMVNPRDVLKEALREGASAMIVVHNHPSGDPTPSRDDLNLTRRLKDACEITGIRFLDHLIIGDGRYVSLADEGKL
jgi:DNA repair protein RadC